MKEQDEQRSTTNNKSLYQRPSVTLIEGKHWSYLQKRYHMTSREVEIARLVCQGFSNEEIAENLNIKQGTVKTHLRNIYRRVRVKNKISLLLRFVSDSREIYEIPEDFTH